LDQIALKKNWFGQINLAKEKLNWQPDTDLKQGLKKIRNWWTSSDYCEPIINTLNQPDKKSISAIIACYKDVEAIPIMYSRLINIFEKLKIDYEIIFVNDGSVDDSINLINNFIKKNKIKNFKVISYLKNKGKGHALKLGVLNAKYEWVLTSDIDLSVELDYFLNWFSLNKLKDNTAYFASRNNSESKIKTIFIRKFMRDNN
jgi:dolichol-phosphate mannosyltransferase